MTDDDTEEYSERDGWKAYRWVIFWCFVVKLIMCVCPFALCTLYVDWRKDPAYSLYLTQECFVLLFGQIICVLQDLMLEWRDEKFGMDQVRYYMQVD